MNRDRQEGQLPFPVGTFTADDHLLAATRADGQPRLAIYPWKTTTVVLGRGSDARVELHLTAIQAAGVPVLRRQGGGCAVVLDAGNAIVSLALPMQGIGRNQAHFDRITSWLIAGLRCIGVDNVTHDGISDLVLDGRKVAGSCIYRGKDLLYYSAAVLVDPDLERVSRYLQHPPREPDYRHGRQHTDFMGSLAGHPDTTSVATFVAALTRVLHLADLPDVGSEQAPDTRSF